MKYLITESQLLKLKNFLLEENEYSEECLKDESVILSDFLGIGVEDSDIGPELSDSEILGMTPENIKPQITKLLSMVKDKTPEELRTGLIEIMTQSKKLNEQQIPYLQRETVLTIWGAPFRFPTVAIHIFLVVAALAILSSLTTALFDGISKFSGNRKRRLSSKAQGCKGGNARNKLVRMRRRKENWKRLLHKLGLR
jgi:hypothetical protein